MRWQNRLEQQHLTSRVGITSRSRSSLELNVTSSLHTTARFRLCYLFERIVIWFGLGRTMAENYDSESMWVSGHDDRWTADVGTQTEPETESDKVAALKKNIRLCQMHLEHCEWHFMAYRQAVRQIPSGLEKFQQVMKEFQDSDEPRCRACELDDLLSEIADLKRFKVNQIAAEGRKRKASCSPTCDRERKLCVGEGDTVEPETKC